jgi:hypothetical protein
MGRGRIAAVLVGIIFGAIGQAPQATALERCKLKVAKTDGTISVSAKGVAGTLRWGTTAGGETNAFFNASTCIAGGKAKACTLGDAGTDACITPPPLCTLYLADDTGSCAIYMPGCTPGARGNLPALQSTVTTLGTNLATLQGTVGTQGSDISTLQASVETLGADLSSLMTHTKTMTLAAPGFTSLASFAIAPGDAAGGLIEYTIVATDGGTQLATERGTILFNATANSITCTVQTTTKLHLGTVNSGCTPGFFNPGSQPGVSVFDNVAFSSPAALATHVVYFRVYNVSNSPTRLEP